MGGIGVSSVHVHDGRPRTGSRRLVHQGLIYDSDEQFLDATVPFCLDGLEQQDAVLAVTSPSNIGLLRQALGGAAGQVEFVASKDWYEAPGRTLAAYYHYVDQRTAAGPHRRVRVVGEPVWHGRDQVASAEWTRYEAAINVAFAACPAWIVCPYDSRLLPRQIVEDARRTHPQLVTGTTVEHSGHYADPASSDGAWDREPAAAPGDGTAPAMSFDADLAALRAFVRTAAAALKVPPDVVQRLVSAANEVATNAVRHGGGSGRVKLWRAGRRVVCEVADGGEETGARWWLGYLPPDPAQPHGHGLWVVRQLCDLVEIHPGPSGTTVRLHLDL
ncbi:anti-sigma factor RsbA family regulatory protein [Nonomuraea sp. NPDC047897]|uniref:anti-sigma factor RsbA family regulatory protein n=1 Tax=Nonomuraea sp. NPDC047897 TaxID=3364346 RepID=UPI0037131EE1